MRIAFVLPLLCLGCFHDVGALRGRGAFDGGPDTGAPAEVAPSVVSDEPAVEEAISCELDGLVARGGAMTGLARGPATRNAVIDRVPVSSCVRADFVTVAPTAGLIVSARTTGSACGDDCGADCDMAPALHVFTGDGVAYRHATTLLPGSELADESIAVDAAMRFVILCRGDAPESHDNLEIDYLAALR